MQIIGIIATGVCGFFSFLFFNDFATTLSVAFGIAAAGENTLFHRVNEESGLWVSCRSGEVERVDLHPGSVGSCRNRCLMREKQRCS